MWNVVGWSSLFLGLVLVFGTLWFKAVQLGARSDRELERWKQEQDDDRA